MFVGESVAHWAGANNTAAAEQCWSLASNLKDAAKEGDATFHIAGLMLLWKRPAVTKMVLAHTATLMKDVRMHGIRLTLTCGGSENRSSRALCEHIGADYIELENRFLGRKHNEALGYLHKRHPDADAIMLMPSDDIANAALLLMQRDAFLNFPDVEVSGVNGIYFLDSAKQQMVYESGYTPLAMQGRKDSLVGAFRAFRPRFFERLNWTAWPDDAQKVLDRKMWDNAAAAVRAQKNITLKSAYAWLRKRTHHLDRQANVASSEELGVMVIDVKSADNIWSLAQITPACFEGILSNCKLFELSHPYDRACPCKGLPVCGLYELFEPCVTVMIHQLASVGAASASQRALVPLEGLHLGNKKFYEHGAKYFCT